MTDDFINETKFISVTNFGSNCRFCESHPPVEMKVFVHTCGDYESDQNEQYQGMINTDEGLLNVIVLRSLRTKSIKMIVCKDDGTYEERKVR